MGHTTTEAHEVSVSRLAMNSAMKQLGEMQPKHHGISKEGVQCEGEVSKLEERRHSCHSISNHHRVMCYCCQGNFFWYCLIDFVWEDMTTINTPVSECVCLCKHFQIYIDETCFMCNDGNPKIVGGGLCGHHDKLSLISAHPSLKFIAATQLGTTGQ
eukprot:5830771-Ditylum_brightwellii.AAC.1